MRITSTIDYTGPFFTRDIDKTVDENVQAMMEGIAREGETDVRAQMTATQGSRAPFGVGRNVKGQFTSHRVSGFVRGRVHSLEDAPWHRTAIISPSRAGLSASQAIALYAAASEIETEVGVFRREKTRLGRARAIQLAELVRGLE